MQHSILISIIIPTLNEEEKIQALLQRLASEHDCETIIVDGGSTDRTLERVEQADKVLHSAPGRGTQMNLGAEHAGGDILLFLHADCIPESGFSRAIQQALTKTEIIGGGFQQTIDHPATKYRWLEWGNAQRVQRLGWVYGDQGLFALRSVFEESGGFPNLPLMEDLEFSKSLKRMGSLILIDHPLHVDPRRWEKSGVVVQTLRNWMFIVLWHLGVSAETLAKWYRQVR